MTSTYLKVLKPHSRLHLDPVWSEVALAAIAEKSWRVVVKPQMCTRGTYLFEDEGIVYCNFQKFEGRSLWAVWGRSQRQVVRDHLNVLPLLVRDLSDASASVEVSPAHLAHWQRTTTNALHIIQNELGSYFNSSSLRTICKSLKRVRDDELVAESYIHGDFHPGNVLSRGNSSPFRLGVSDLENLTVGTAFVDVLYCAIWAQFADDVKPYLNLIRYLEHKLGRRLNEIDLGLSATLMIGQAASNGDRIRRRILNGLNWLIDQLLILDSL